MISARLGHAQPGALRPGVADHSPAPASPVFTSGSITGSGSLAGTPVSSTGALLANFGGSGTVAVTPTAATASGAGALAGSGALAATPGSPTAVLLTFDGGTNGAALATGGAITAVGSAPPTYSANAAVHGALGVTGSAGQPCTFTTAKPAAWTAANGDFSFSLYCTPRSLAAGAVRMATLQTVPTHAVLGSVRVHTDGTFDISNSGGTRIVNSAGLTWVANHDYRLDCVYNGSTNALTVSIYADTNVEGYTPDKTMTATLSSQPGGWGQVLWSPSYTPGATGATVDLDTVRMWDGQQATILPYAPQSLGSTALTGAGTLTSGAPQFAGAGALSGSGGLGVSAILSVGVAHLWQGAPTTSSFTVKAHTTGCTSVGLAVSGDPSMSSPTIYGLVGPDVNGYVNLTASGLAPGARYYYQLQDTPSGGTATPIGAVGRARTAPDGLSHRIAFGSCITTNATDSHALDDVVAWDPDLFMFLGDFAYTGNTSTDPNSQRLTFENQIAGAAGMSALVRDVPWAMCVSDHDAGPDNGDSNNAYTAANIVAYNQIVPTYPMADTRSPMVGRYQTWVLGRVRYILLDIRNTDRSPGANVDDANKTMLGATQKAWLKSQLLQPEPVKVIVSDVAWLGAASTTNGPDKWWSYSTERQEIANFITSNNVKVVLMHGDTHALAVATPAKNTWGGFPVYCASPMRNTGGGLNLSAFSSYWNNSGGAATSYGRVTVTDDGNTITFSYVGWDATAGVARVTQTDVFSAPTAVTASATLGGSGGLSVGVSATASLGGSGSLSSSQAFGSGSLSGSGALVVAGAPVESITAGASGSGALVVSSGPVGAAVAVALAGTGTAVVGAAPSVAALWSLAGAGTLVAGTAAPALTGVLATSGSGALSATVAAVGLLAPVALAGAGALTVLAAAATAGTPACSGSGALSAAGAAAASVVAAVAGSGALAVSGAAGGSSASALSGSGALALAGTLAGQAGGAALGGSGVLALTVGAVAVAAGAALGGSGALVGTPGTLTAGGAGVLGGSGTVTAVGGISGLQLALALAGSGALAASALVGGAVSPPAQLGAAGSLAALGVAGGGGPATLAGSGLLATSGGAQVAGAAALTGGSALVVTVLPPNALLAVAVSGSGVVVVGGALSDGGNYVGLGGLGALAAGTGISGPQVTPALGALGGLVAGSSAGLAGAPALSGSGALNLATLTGPAAGATLAGTGAVVAGGAVPTFTPLVGLAGSGAVSSSAATAQTAAAAPSGLGTLAAANADALAAAANLGALGALRSLAVLTQSGAAGLTGIGRLALPRQRGVLIGADHPLWVQTPTGLPTPWVRFAPADFTVTLSPDPFLARRSPDRAAH